MCLYKCGFSQVAPSLLLPSSSSNHREYSFSTCLYRTLICYVFTFNFTSKYEANNFLVIMIKILYCIVLTHNFKEHKNEVFNILKHFSNNVEHRPFDFFIIHWILMEYMCLSIKFLYNCIIYYLLKDGLVRTYFSRHYLIIL